MVDRSWMETIRTSRGATDSQVEEILSDRFYPKKEKKCNHKFVGQRKDRGSELALHFNEFVRKLKPNIKSAVSVSVSPVISL